MADTQDGRSAKDFFVSYTKLDQMWAVWVAWALEEAGYQVLLQAWDFSPGSNWIQRMHSAIRDSTRTIAILSPAYLESTYSSAEWQAAWVQDPAGTRNKLLAVRVSECEQPGLLVGVVAIDLFGVDEQAAQDRLLEMAAVVTAGRAKPTVAPWFPGTDRMTSVEPPFPGGAPPDQELPPVREDRRKVTHLSDFRRRGVAAAEAPDADRIHGLIIEFLGSAELVAASYSAGDGEYAWLRLGVDAQLTSIDSEFGQITERLGHMGMTDDLSTFDLTYSLHLYSGAANDFLRTLDSLESRRSTAERRTLLDHYQAARRSLADLLWRIYRELTAAPRPDGPFGRR